ncbi:hypothetical protein QRX60_17615 [Amycolatopsis mongoliensis]|uniref:HNH endonuclease n=1 Tax=Amycolatopsis mongoliensis TaxID=715475 RepID=A0A9Y2JXR7_9PSEU|nr:hypothetical protein [Amycolatopsis sp. 4-36]WIY05574.1 hypothetical protein QRX60_17615 [Amycolatopsis sp. 4-36]
MAQVEICAVCGNNPATGQGEHVWPQWFLKAMDALGPPKKPWAVNSIPVVNKRGVPIHHSQRQRVLLPVCRTCNGELNKRFEMPAREVVKELATNGWSGEFNQAEWHSVGMWWAKVLLMLGHPKARLGDRRLNDIAIRFDNPPHDYRWMVDGSSPPVDLSLWVFRGAIEDSESEFTMVLPDSVAMRSGSTALCHELSLVTEGLCVTVVSHPGVSIDHPLVNRQDAWELLHNPPQRGDLSKLRSLPGKAVSWMRGEKVPEGHSVGPDQFSRLTAMIGYESDDVLPEPEGI